MLGIVAFGMRYLWWTAGRLRRRLVRPPEYVVFLVEGPLPDLPPPRRGFLERHLAPAPPLSIWELSRRFEAVAGDPRVKGVVLHLRPLGLSPAKLDSLRGLIRNLRSTGKRVVAWASHYNRAAYYVACAADEVLLQPGGSVGPLGLRQGYVFVAEALERLGVKGEFIRVSPYKTASDIFTHKEMSAEAREMADWLADAHYREHVQAIREGRRLDEDAARRLIDDSPFEDRAALEAGAVDALVHAEELPAHLGFRTGRGKQRPSRLAGWEAARRRVLLPPPPRPGRFVALLRIEGTIVDGWSYSPPLRPPVPFLFDERVGDLSVVQQARRALADRRAASVLVYVNSPGGSATASEAIAAALERLAAAKPVVVWMGEVAASGGYYVATPARWIVAQPGTITGSIGVLAGKFVQLGLLQRLGIRQQWVERGESAGFFGWDRPFTPHEQEKVRAAVDRAYQLFLERVARARRIPTEAAQGVGGGRVWTGSQALERSLVDELGGLDEALRKARALAGLHPKAAVREIPAVRRFVAPPDPARAMELLRLVGSARPLCLMPILPAPCFLEPQG